MQRDSLAETKQKQEWQWQLKWQPVVGLFCLDVSSTATTGTAAGAAGVVGISKTARHTGHLKGALSIELIQMRIHDCNITGEY